MLANLVIKGSQTQTIMTVDNTPAPMETIKIAKRLHDDIQEAKEKDGSFTVEEFMRLSLMSDDIFSDFLKILRKR